MSKKKSKEDKIDWHFALKSKRLRFPPDWKYFYFELRILATFEAKIAKIKLLDILACNSANNPSF